jgi:hypothetical protein
MEQGPVLEATGVPLGPVAGIAGQTRLAVQVHGVQVTGPPLVPIMKPAKKLCGISPWRAGNRPLLLFPLLPSLVKIAGKFHVQPPFLSLPLYSPLLPLFPNPLPLSWARWYGSCVCAHMQGFVGVFRVG